MYNRDHYDRLIKTIERLVHAEHALCEAEYHLSEHYNFEEIENIRKRLLDFITKVDSWADILAKEIDFGDDNRTDKQDFIDIMQRTKPEHYPDKD